GARLTIRQAPAITQQPQPITAQAGSQVALDVTATGTDPLQYQWSRNNQPVAGATNHRLIFVTLGGGDTGTYIVTVSNLAGSITSSPVTVSLSSSALTTWRQLEPGLDMDHPLCAAGTPDGLYIGSLDGVMSWSPDGGQTWQRRRVLQIDQEIEGIAFGGGRY